MSTPNFELINRPDKLLQVHVSLNTDSSYAGEAARRGQTPALSGVSCQRHRLYSIQLPSIFGTVVYQVALQTWCETGFGNHSLKSEFENGRVKAIFWAGTSFMGHVSKEELHQLKQFRSMLHHHIR